MRLDFVRGEAFGENSEEITLLLTATVAELDELQLELDQVRGGEPFTSINVPHILTILDDLYYVL